MRSRSRGARRLSGGVLVLALAQALALLACGPPAAKPPRDRDSMVHVPAGEFVMGRADGAEDERPERRVWVSEFWIDRTEVTNAQYQAYCDATEHLYPKNPEWDGNYFLGQPQSPALNLTFDQATSYCAWAGKRLPTEAEWEKAARGTDGRLYPWGNAWVDSVANLAGYLKTDRFDRAAPVGSFPAGASPYGALDMAGNVREWVADWYAFDAYATGAQRDPRGPASPTPWRALRGGGFTSPKTDAEVSNRDKNNPQQMLHHLGCRCAWSPR